MACGGGRVAPLGPPLVAFGPSGCLFPGQGAAGGQKEASGVDFGSHLGSNGVVFNDLLGSPRGVFFITLSNLFLQQNCSENRDQRVLRVKSAQHGNTVKHKSCFQIFEVPRTAGRTFETRAPNIPPKMVSRSLPGSLRGLPKSGPRRPQAARIQELSPGRDELSPGKDELSVGKRPRGPSSGRPGAQDAPEGSGSPSGTTRRGEI